MKGTIVVLLGLAVLALPDVGESPMITTVILVLAVLPLTTTGNVDKLDRDAIMRQAGCEGQVTITIAEETPGESERGWIVIVQCPVIPIAEILRTPVWEAPRQVRGSCVPSPFAGWCQNGKR